MLDKSKIIKELQNATSKLFSQRAVQLNLLSECFNKIKDKTLFSNFPVTPFNDTYKVISVDGSQIYPDRHQGIPCFLLNFGSAQLSYKIDIRSQDRCVLKSEPKIFTEQDFNILSPEYINALRTEFEFAKSLDLMKEHINFQNSLCLVDGSLIFWNLDSEQSLQEQFLSKYLNILEEFYKNKLLIAGYISFPKSRELINLLKNNCIDEFNHLYDTDLTSFYLKPNERSSIFLNNCMISKVYPEHLRSYFVYLNLGYEIARIELPAWIAQDNNLVNKIASIILDQTIKGDGYPVVLAEAHEQAVIKSADRDFFYQLLQKITQNNHLVYLQSRKSLKKRFTRV